MKSIVAALALMATAPVFAEDQPASQASIRELMEITNSRALLEQTYAQLDGLMEKAINDALGGRKLNSEQEKLLAEMRQRTVSMLREEFGWDQLEPYYIKLYAETFSQAEIDGMNAFYKTEAGKAVISKMPQLMQHLMQMVMERMQAVGPKLQALQEEFKKKMAEAGEKD